MRKLMFPAAAATTVAVSIGLAMAGEAVVAQKDKKFGKDAIAVGVGDTVKFVNEDSVAHNVHSRGAAETFDLGVQKPGETSGHTFSKPGTYKVRCAIHPKMKLDITVK